MPFRQEFAGVLGVWQDPKDKKTYVVEGHHRLEMAERTPGIETLDVKYIDAPNVETAKARGALSNIAGGQGTAMDAGKFMRETGKTSREDFREEGVSLKSDVASKGLVLSQLEPTLFDKVARGQMEEETALAIGKHLKLHSSQIKLAEILRKKEESGKRYAPKVIEEMAKEMAATPSQRTTEQTLFGDMAAYESLFADKNELKSSVRGDFAKNLNDFKVLSSERRAENVSGAGNVIDTEANKKIADEQAEVLAVFDKLVNRKGPIADVLNQSAAEWAKARTKPEKDAVREKALHAITAAVKAELESPTAAFAASKPGSLVQAPPAMMEEPETVSAPPVSIEEFSAQHGAKLDKLYAQYTQTKERHESLEAAAEADPSLKDQADAARRQYEAVAHKINIAEKEEYEPPVQATAPAPESDAMQAPETKAAQRMYTAPTISQRAESLWDNATANGRRAFLGGNPNQGIAVPGGEPEGLSKLDWSALTEPQRAAAMAGMGFDTEAKANRPTPPATEMQSPSVDATLEELEMATDRPEDPPWIKRLVEGKGGEDGNAHVLIEGESGSGKSLLAKKLAFTRMEQGQDVHVVDTHNPEAWGGAKSVFQGKDAGAEAAVFMREELESRKAESNRAKLAGEDPQFEKMTIVFSDFARLMKDSPELQKEFRTILTESRKFKMSVIADTTRFTGAESGMKGIENVRQNFGQKVQLFPPGPKGEPRTAKVGDEVFPTPYFPGFAERRDVGLIQPERAETSKEVLRRRAEMQLEKEKEAAAQKEVTEQLRRATDEDYRADAERKDAARAATEQARIEKLALAAMTPEERIEHMAVKEAERVKESRAVKGRAKDLLAESVTAPARNEVEQEADKRLEWRAKEKAIDQEMRALDENYRAEQELKDAYLENARAIRELTEQARIEKLALAAMTDEERVEHLARKKVEEQTESQAVKEKADELVYGKEYVEQEKLLRERAEQAKAEKRAFESMTPEERVEHRARKEVEEQVEREKVKEKVRELRGEPGQEPSQFDPYAEAEKKREQDVRREQVRAAYDERYGEQQQPKSAIDAGLDLAQQMRGTLGAAFGPMAGAVLDLVSAVRKAEPEGKSGLRKEAERRNADLPVQAEEVPFVTAAPDPDEVIQEVQPLPTALAAPVEQTASKPGELADAIEMAAPARAERVEQATATPEGPAKSLAAEQQKKRDEFLPSEKAFVMDDPDAQSPLTGLPEIPSQSSATPAARPQRSAGSLLGRERAPSVQRELGAGEPAPSSYLMGSARPEAQSPRDANLPAPPTSPVAAAEAEVSPPAIESQEISANRDRESPASLNLPDISSQPSASSAKADSPLSGPLPKSAPVEKAPTTNPASAAMQAPKAPPAGVAAPASRAAAQGVASTASSAASSGVAASGTTSAATAAAGAAGGAAGGGAAAGGAAAGAAGAGGMAAAGLAAAAGPAAVVVAAVVALQEFRDAAMGVAETMGDVGASLATFKDGSEGVYRLGDATKSVSEKLFWVSPAVGIFGSVVGESITSVGKLDDAVKATSQRLGQYHAGLATQNAQQEVRETMRDINRANRFGQVTAGANEARFNMEQRLSDLSDRFVPFVMAISQKVFTALERGVAIADDGFKMLLRSADGILEIMERILNHPMLAAIGGIGETVRGIRVLIAEALEDNDNVAEQQHWDAFLSSARNLTGTINQMAPAPGAVIQAAQAPF